MQTFLRFLTGRQVLSVSLSHTGEAAMPTLEILMRSAFPGHNVTVEKQSGTDIRGRWDQVRYEVLLPCTADTLYATVIATSRTLRDICLTPGMIYT